MLKKKTNSPLFSQRVVRQRPLSVKGHKAAAIGREKKKTSPVTAGGRSSYVNHIFDSVSCGDRLAALGYNLVSQPTCCISFVELTDPQPPGVAKHTFYL